MLDDLLPLNMIGMKKVQGGALEDSMLVDGVAFRKTFSCVSGFVVVVVFGGGDRRVEGVGLSDGHAQLVPQPTRASATRVTIVSFKQFIPCDMQSSS